MPTPTFFEGLTVVRSELTDGGLSLAASGTRPSILIVGPAAEGPTNFPQIVVEPSDVKRLYGEKTVLERKVAEIVAQAGTEAYFIYVMRIGGIAPKIKLTSHAGGTITLTPLNHEDKEATERLKVLLLPKEVDGVKEQRVVIYDTEEEGYVWDSHSILQIVEKPFFAEVTGDFQDSTGSPYYHGIDANGLLKPDLIDAIVDKNNANYTQGTGGDYHKGTTDSHSAVWPSYTTTETINVEIIRTGDDGNKIPLVQRYVNLDRALESLAFKEFDYLIPCGGYYLDAPNISDSINNAVDKLVVHHELQGSTPVHSSIDFSSLPTGTGATATATDLSLDPNNVLGWLWQTEYEGKRYYYMASKKGWDNFEAMEFSFTLTENDQVLPFSVTDQQGDTASFEVTISSEFKAAGLTDVEITSSSVQPISGTSVSVIGSKLRIVIGRQNATVGDIKNYLETKLQTDANTAVGVSGTITSSATLQSPTQILELVSTFSNLTTTPLLGSGSITWGIEFDDSLDPFSVKIEAGTGLSVVETAGSDGQELVITYDPTAAMQDLNDEIAAIISGSSNITGGSGAFTFKNLSSTGDLSTILASGVLVKDTVLAVLGQAYEMEYTNNYLDHEELTGQEIPAPVSALFQAALESEFRECSFAHQIGSFCHKASSTWKTMMTCMSFEGPPNGNNPIEVGKIPTYTSIAGNLAIDTAAEGGKGILGYKFSAGAPAYRAQVLGSIASASDGYAYGGLILTRGDNLPPGIEAYGIDDSDEAKDQKGYGVDIGKYIVPCAMFVNHTNGNSDPQYFGDTTGIIASMIGITPIGNEPIGPANGSISGISPDFREQYSYRNIGKLAAAGYATIVSSGSRGIYINNMRTLAHRYSDYRKVSTIRAVNRVVQGIRTLAEDYIGLAYNSSNVASLRTAVNGYLRSEQTEGVHNGAVAQIAFSREDRMLGNITIRLTIVPPYAIESINIVTSLIADESNLQ